MRVLAATALVCGLASQAWAQAATAALPAIPDLAPLSVPVDSAATHRSWASGRGIYAFFASDGARAVLRRAGLSVGDDGLVYIGQTKNSFGARLSQHFKGSSNLGRSLGSVLKAAPDDVSRFIRSHFRVAMLSLDDAVIGDVEARLIRTKSPPLNLRTQIKARIAAAAGELGRRLDARGSELGLQVAHLREQVGQLREGLPEGLREAIAGARSLAAAAASGVR